MMYELKKTFFIPTLVILVCFAFLLRLEVCRELKVNDRQVSEPSIYTDMYTYKHYSEQIVKGEYKRDFYYQPFYYAVFLPVIKQIFGFGIWPVILSQCLLSVLTIWFAALVSAMLWGRRAAIITALLLTFSTIMMLYLPYHLIGTLQAFWIALIAFLSLKYLDFERKSHADKMERSNINWSILGFIISLGILTRGNIWFFVPGIIAAVVVARFKYAEPGRINVLKKVLPVVALVVMIILPQLPFAWKNTQIKGRLSGPSTAAGAVLSLGNTPESPPGGRDPGMGPGPMEYPETCRFWSATADDVSVFTRMWRWFSREPLAFCELQWRKMMLFWDRREIPNNIAMEHQGLKSQTLQISGLIPGNSVDLKRGMTSITMNIIPFSILLLMLSFAAVLYLIAKTLKRPDKKSGSGYFSTIAGRISGHPGKYLILYFILAYWLGTAAFYILARFRMPILPLLAVFAGGFLHYFIIRWKAGRERVAGMILALVAALLFVNFGYDCYRYILEAPVMRIVRPDGVISPINDHLLVMDNGPYSFGSWHSLELKQGISLVKTFSVSNILKKGRTVKFKIDLVWEVPGEAVFEINGKNFTLKEPRPIKKVYEFSVALGEDEKITIIPRNMDCRIFTIVDFQRNYSRTAFNGENPGGELVCQLVFSQKE